MMRGAWLLAGLLCVPSGTGDDVLIRGLTPTFHWVQPYELHEDSDHDDTITLREASSQRISWQAANAVSEEVEHSVPVKILAINDFHGQLSAGRRVGNRPVGGAAVLAAYLRNAQKSSSDSGFEDTTIIAHAGDHVGASPPESSFFQDEPSIMWLNLLANQSCTYADRMHPKCNLVGTPGNHEFDEGQAEMLRLIEGGTHRSGPFLQNPYLGARFPYISANVVDKDSREPILPPFVVKEVNGIRLAFIGAVLKETPSLVTSTGIAGLAFLDEADSINRYVRQLREDQGLRAFVVLIHQGGGQTPYEGPTRPGDLLAGQAIMRITDRLDDDVDVVVSAHSHAFTNALVKKRSGRVLLLTQAFASGTAYADIRLMITRRSGEVAEKSATIVTTYADQGPGLSPDPEVKRLVTQVETQVAPLAMRVISEAVSDILRAENVAGESALGNLIADAQRQALGTDFAFMNPGGIRTDLPKGSLVYRDLFAVQPFGNSLVRMTLTGDQIYELLNQQWSNQPQRILKVSGLTYTWDNDRPVGDRVVEVRKNGAPIDHAAVYSVTVNDFLAAGGDNFTVFLKGHRQTGGPIDLKALIAYLQGLPQPFGASIEARITRRN